MAAIVYRPGGVMVKVGLTIIALLLVMMISGTEAAVYNFASIPGSGAMVLLGTGLIGVAGWGLRRFRK